MNPKDKGKAQSQNTNKQIVASYSMKLQTPSPKTQQKPHIGSTFLNGHQLSGFDVIDIQKPQTQTKSTTSEAITNE